MIPEGSRYQQGVSEFAQAHSYDDAGRKRTDSGKDRVHNRDTVYLITTSIPKVMPPRNYMFRSTDNIQLLAYRALRDPTQWWVVADANPHIRHPFDMRMGDLIHVPG